MTPWARRASVPPVSKDRQPTWPLAAGVHVLQDVSAISSPIEGYLRRHRLRVKTCFDDGSRSEAYVVDYVDRPPGRRDATGFVLYARPRGARVADTVVLLRRQLRYASYVALGRPLTAEVLAGVIEHDETPEANVVREAWEEASVTLDPASVRALGRPFFTVPGLFTERIVPFCASVPERALEEALDAPPPGDGSPFEEGSTLVALTLAEAFELMEAPAPSDPSALTLDDAKTEIVLTRLWRRLEDESP